MSAIQFSIWRFGVHLTAECKAFRLPWRRRHTAPDENCGCGIYAAHLETLARSYRSLGPPSVFFPVLGPVLLWGTVVVAQEGWRAEFAYPQRLFVMVHGGRRQAARQLGVALERYGVPVHVIDPPADRHGEGLAELLRAA